MKLVYEYSWSIPFEANGVETIPFECSSIEDFQYMVLEKIDKYHRECIEKFGEKDGVTWYRNGYINVLGIDIDVGDLEDSILNGIYELEEWFETHKISI